MDNSYVEYAVEKSFELLAIDSPTGYTEKCAAVALEKFQELGFKAVRTKKGGVLVDLGGKKDDDGLVIMAHLDTLGCMVAEVKGNGRLRLTNLGGLHAKGCEGENVVIYTRDGKTYEGTLQMPNPSLHVNNDFEGTERTWDSFECVIDEDVKNGEDVKALGIDVGDPVCVEPRSRVTSSGYIKSRFLDDKLCVGILYGLAKYIKDQKITLDRHTYLHVTVYEE
ncbi:MAG: peptidase M42, partial [Spirochaetales bacterium]|nr:peptidase M42 [Candidatus Physcosoma equi]